MASPHTPEHALSAAILRQAWRDRYSPDARVRQEALTFWTTPESVDFWDDLLTLDGALRRHAAGAAEALDRQHARGEQLTLF
jgi:hypothetical protein